MGYIGMNSHPLMSTSRRGQTREKVLLTGIADIGTPVDATILDLSSSGAAISANIPTSVERGVLRFRRPDTGEMFTAEFVIRWRDKGTVGVQFCNTPGLGQQWEEWSRQHVLASTAKTDSSGAEIPNIPAIHRLVHRARMFTGSECAILAASSGEMVTCHTASGVDIASSAPILGSEVDLFRDCLAGGSPVHCEMASTDTRLAGDRGRQVQFESAIVVPVNDIAHRPIAALALFAATAAYFNDTHLVIAQDAAEKIQEAVTAAYTDRFHRAPARAVPDADSSSRVQQAMTELTAKAQAESGGKGLSKVAIALGVLALLAIGVFAVLVSRDANVFGAKGPVAGAAPTSAKAPAAPAKGTVALTEGTPSIAEDHPGTHRLKDGIDKNHAKIDAGKPIVRSLPEYPAEALRRGIQGEVEALLLINDKGIVENVQVVSGDTLLAGAAVSAMSHWRFGAWRADGKATAIRLPVMLTFRISNGSTERPAKSK